MQEDLHCLSGRRRSGVSRRGTLIRAIPTIVADNMARFRFTMGKSQMPWILHNTELTLPPSPRVTPEHPRRLSSVDGERALALRRLGCSIPMRLPPTDHAPTVL